MPYRDAETKKLAVIWFNMIQRCLDRKHPAFKDYGKRGIWVTSRWQGSDGFKNFLADMGPRPSPTHTLERKNNESAYGPENCCWATRKEQANNRRSNRHVTYQGRTQTAAQWAEELFPENPGRVQTRLAKGWSVERALTTPIREKNVSRQEDTLTYRGETLTVREWTERVFPDRPKTIPSRLNAGWSVERILSTPTRKYSRGR